MTTENRAAKIIHVGRIKLARGKPRYFFLRRMDPHHFVWFEEKSDNIEKESAIAGPTQEEAIRLANRQWKGEFFQTLHCGFKYSLPERDEHGINALFHQMVASYKSSNGIYFDEDLGYNCFVNFASQEALNLWRRLEQENKLP